MKVLVKLGGTLLDAPEARDALAGQIAQARAGGTEVVVVHGGGKQMTRYLAERGVESRFVNGLRVTTPETVDAVLKVFAGSVNHELVASLNRAGAQAVGLSGIDAFLAEAEQMDPALGAVGRVTQSNPALLEPADGERVCPGGGVRGGRSARADLQRERGPDGGGLRDGVWRAPVDLPHRCGRGARCNRGRCGRSSPPPRASA